MKRLLLKTISWRVVSTVVTVATVMVVSGDWRKALGTGVLDSAVKFGIAFGHEWFWAVKA